MVPHKNCSGVCRGENTWRVAIHNRSVGVALTFLLGNFTLIRMGDCAALTSFRVRNPSGTAAQAAAKVRMYRCNLIPSAFTI
jgi:hypothetical protein